jgi:hypothetical protein
MERNLIALLIVIAGYGLCFAQVGGNSNYSQPGGKARAKQNEQNKKAAAQQESPPIVVRAQGETLALTPAAPGVSIEASMLMKSEDGRHDQSIRRRVETAGHR